MFNYYDTLIDTVQTSKKQVVNTFIQNEAMKNAMVTFIDAQADYTKKAVKAGVDTSTVLIGELVKLSQDALKFDYSKFGEGFGKAFTTVKK